VIIRSKKGVVSFGKVDLWIQGLIVLNLLLSGLDTVSGLPGWSVEWLFWFECFSVGVFSFEYFVRVFWARPVGSYAVSFFGVVDLLAILPFYLALGVDLRALRAFRLLRLFRLLKIARYGSAIQRFKMAYFKVKEELVLFGVTSLILLYIASVGIYYFEGDVQPDQFSSVYHCMWWATTTLTTVGYGDMYPVTVGGRIFTFFILIIGLGIVAVPTGLFASALSSVRADEELECE